MFMNSKSLTNDLIDLFFLFSRVFIIQLDSSFIEWTLVWSLLLDVQCENINIFPSQQSGSQREPKIVDLIIEQMNEFDLNWWRRFTASVVAAKKRKFFCPNYDKFYSLGCFNERHRSIKEIIKTATERYYTQSFVRRKRSGKKRKYFLVILLLKFGGSHRWNPSRWMC